MNGTYLKLQRDWDYLYEKESGISLLKAKQFPPNNIITTE